MKIEKGGYMVKNKDGKYVATPKLKKVMMDTAQLSGGVQAVGGKTVSALKLLSQKEKAFHNAGRDATKRMADKKIWDKLMAARARLLDVRH